MENMKRLLYDANDAGNFIFAAMKGIDHGGEYSIDCDGKTLYLEGGSENWRNSDNPFPVPFYVSIIYLFEKEAQEEVLSGFSKILQQESERIREYSKTLIPFFQFDDSTVNYVVTEQGLVVKSTSDVVTDTQVPIDSFHIALCKDRDMCMAIDAANHHRYQQQLNPKYVREIEKRNYSPLKHIDLSLVQKHAEEVRETNPIRSRELKALLQ